MSELPYKEILKTLGIFALGFAIIVSVAQITGKLFLEDTGGGSVVEPTLPAIVECPADLVAFASTSKKVDILADKISNGYQGELKGYRVVLERKGLTADVVCGYLLYQVSFGKKPIELNNMLFYMRPTNSELGGHIIPDDAKGAIIDTFSDRTQVLMPLSSITYDGIEKNPIKEIDWAPLFNLGKTIEFQVALSAAVPDGYVNRVQLAYKCVNKETRRPDDTCEITVKEVLNGLQP